MFFIVKVEGGGGQMFSTMEGIIVKVKVKWSEFLATDTEVSGSIPGATRFSE